jgi:hypothetical protein
MGNQGSAEFFSNILGFEGLLENSERISFSS